MPVLEDEDGSEATVAAPPSTKGAKAQATSTGGKSKVTIGGRSPSYPGCDVSEAIDRIKRLYTGLRLQSAPFEALVKSMGYAGVSGTSRVMTASLKKYGLLDVVGDNYKLSADARAIAMLSPEDADFVAAAKRCALKPSVFADLYKNYGVDLPEDNRVVFILTSKGFSPEAANLTVKNFRKTLDYLKKLPGALPDLTTPQPDDERGSETAPKSGASEEQSGAIGEGQQSQNAKQSSSEQERKEAPQLVVEPTAELQVTLLGGCKARVTFTGNVTQQSVTRLIRYLDLFKDEQPDATVSSASPKHDASIGRADILDVADDSDDPDPGLLNEDDEGAQDDE